MLSLFSKKEESIAPDGSKFSPSKVATISDIQRVESEFGFELPQLLKDLYINTGNGGFGPGYGVMGIPGGFTDDQGSNILSLYQDFVEPYPEDPAWKWPKGRVPICHWGCVIYSCVHCLEENLPVYIADIGVKEDGEPMESILKISAPTFDAWVESWKK